MKEKIVRRISDCSLKKKMFFPILVTIFFFAAASYIGMKIVSDANNKLLYQSTAASLTFSATNLSNDMDSIFKLSDMVIADQSIQDNMMILKNSDNAIPRLRSYQILYNALQSYYQQNKQANVSYVNIYSDDYTVQTYTVDVEKPLDDRVKNDLIGTALNAKGAPVAVTKYCGQYGLFVVRSIRQSQNLSLEDLGVMVICIDPEKMVQTATSSENEYKTPIYLLSSENTLIYHSDGFSGDVFREAREQTDKPYEVITLNGEKYFAVRKYIADYKWNFLVLVEYDTIYRSVGFSYILFIFIIVLCILLSLFLSNALIRPLMRDFNNLVTKMKAFGENDTELLDVGYDYTDRTDEFGVLHREFDKMAIQIQNLIKVNYTSEILRKDAQLKSLEMQMNPHFLYNTLQSINWRAKAIGEKQISQMVEALGRLLRITLDEKAADYSLGRELELVRSYLTIQQMRFDKRLCCSWDVDDRLLDAYIPKLTVQPLVDNAIHYGLEEITEVCRIDIAVRNSGKNVEIMIRNNGSNFEESLMEKLKDHAVRPNGLGIGLLNIQERIQLTFGEKYGLSLFNDGENAVAQLTIPYCPVLKE